MRTAVDSSVLIAILRNEKTSSSWLTRLAQCRTEGRLLICDVVYAELAVGFSSIELLNDAVAKLGIEFDAIGPESAFLAGKIHKAYREARGPRQRMIPDFLIGAHASTQADRLAAADRGYFQDYFEDLPIVTT